jgi:hypothetical protein
MLYTRKEQNSTGTYKIRYDPDPTEHWLLCQSHKHSKLLPGAGNVTKFWLQLQCRLQFTPTSLVNLGEIIPSA